MRKFIFVLFATLTFVIHASAGVGSSDRSTSSNASYPKAVGLRLGLGLEASYQHALGDNFIQTDLGAAHFMAPNLNATLTYNYMIAKSKGGRIGQLGFYAGPGVGIGWDNFWGNNAMNIYVAGQIGLEYSFRFPIQISVDWRPQLGLALSSHYGAGFYLGYLYPTASLLYRF